MGLLKRLKIGGSKKRKTKKGQEGHEIDKGVSIKKLRGSYPFILSINTVEEYLT